MFAIFANFRAIYTTICIVVKRNVKLKFSYKSMLGKNVTYISYT